MHNYDKDIQIMHEKFGVYDRLEEGMDADTFSKYLLFRADMLMEEVEEFKEAIENHDTEGAIDALVDLKVFLFGTEDILVGDSVIMEEAWRRVMEANMRKEPGVKPGRPNPFNFPDMIKPKGWEDPDLTGLHEFLEGTF